MLIEFRYHTNKSGNNSPSKHMPWDIDGSVPNRHKPVILSKAKNLRCTDCVTRSDKILRFAQNDIYKGLP